MLDVYRGNRPDAEPHEMAAAIETDRMFTVPAIRMADAQVCTQPEHVAVPLRLAHTGRWWSVGCAHHFLEVPFAFDQLDNDQARGFVGGNPPRALADATHNAWASFIKDGNPNHAQLPEWPQV